MICIDLSHDSSKHEKDSDPNQGCKKFHLHIHFMSVTGINE